MSSGARLLSLSLLLLASCRPAGVLPMAIDPCIIGEQPSSSAQLSFSDVRIQPAGALVRVDCTGAVRPELARAWTDSAGLLWRFTLDAGARNPDGTRLTVRDVMTAWSASAAASAAILSLGAVGDHELHVELRAPARVELFSDSIFAVQAERAGFVRSPFSGRAAIDAGVDLVATADRDVIDYARARNDYVAAPLPWTRTYVIATGGPAAQHRIPDEVAAGLARDLVGGNARTAAGPFWWESGACVLRGPSFGTRAEARDVVYPRGDAVARGIAERIVAQSWPRPATWLSGILPAAYGAAGAPRAVALEAEAMRTALRSRVPLAAVLPMPRVHDGACVANAAPVAMLLPGGWQVTPLLDVHDVLLHRRGVGILAVDAYGAIRRFVH